VNDLETIDWLAYLVLRATSRGDDTLYLVTENRPRMHGTLLPLRTIGGKTLWGSDITGQLTPTVRKESIGDADLRVGVVSTRHVRIFLLRPTTPSLTGKLP
jgi:hypothetical protein